MTYSGQTVARKQLRACPVSTHSPIRSTRSRHNAAHTLDPNNRPRRKDTAIPAATAQQNTAAMTPLLQLQTRLQDSGATLAALDLSYKQTVAARKVRQGEVAVIT